jgi:hypothetical protein
MVRRAVTVWAVAALLVGMAQPARAVVWSGSCALSVRFNFSPYVTSATSTPGMVSSPDYWLTVGPAADLNPTTTTKEPCAASLAGVPPIISTAVTAEGTATAWTCEGILGGGRWTQSWGGGLPTVSGTHTVSGGPGGITITITSLPSANFVAEIELVVTDALRMAQCGIGSILSLQTTGIMQFQLR